MAIRALNQQGGSVHATAACARIPVVCGHIKSVIVELERDYELEDA